MPLMICRLLEIIASVVSDRETIDELVSVSADKRRWKDAHALFRRIRAKTLKADAAGDRRLIAQYTFEEVCAKSIYNVSDGTGPYPPFDAEISFYVIPVAFKAARSLGIDQACIVAVVAGAEDD